MPVDVVLPVARLFVCLMAKIEIYKQKIDGFLRKVISVISDSKGDLYHLGMLITLVNNTKVIVEKNHVVNIELGNPIKSNTEVINVDLKGKTITLNELLDKAIASVGANQIFEYSATGGRNCQNFCVDVLRANDLLTKQYEDFTLQDLSDLKNKSRLGDETTEVIKGLTDVRNSIDSLTGYGIKNSMKIK